MVKWPQQSEERRDLCEGRSAEEAVGRARELFGDAAPVRCWKVRRGGLMGFFAREVYVAGIDPPEGAPEATAPRSRAKAPIARAPKGGGFVDDTPSFIGEVGIPWRPDVEAVPLSDLVESTNDEVRIGGERGFETAFFDVLAQAEAALENAPRADPPSTFHDRGGEVPWRAHDPLGGEARPPLIAGYPPMSRPPAPTAQIAGLADVVASFGVPVAYRPEREDFTLDDLVRSLSLLPVPRPLPLDVDAVVVVVGPKRESMVAAKGVARLMGLDEGEIYEAECTAATRQRISRRRSTSRTVVVVEATPRSKDLAEVGRWIETLDPDYVVGTVSATAKSSDVAAWSRELPGIDALALCRTRETAAPGEMMGDKPILLVEGQHATVVRWVSLILSGLLGVS